MNSSHLYNVLKSTVDIKLLTILTPMIIGIYLNFEILNLGQSLELIDVAKSDNNSLVVQITHALLGASYFFSYLYISTLTYKLINSDSFLIKKNILLIIIFFTGLQPLYLIYLIGFDLGNSLIIALSILLTFFIINFHIYNSKKSFNFIGITSIFILCLFVLISLTDRSFANALGGIGVLYLATSFWVLVYVFLFGLVPALIFERTFFVLGPFLFILSLFLFKTNKVVDDSNYRKFIPLVNKSLHVEDYFENWVHKLNFTKERSIFNEEDDTAGLSRRIPVYFVISEGGGIRAAYWTAAVLAEIDKSTNKLFSETTFAYSGISGGALGVGIYNICENKDLIIHQKCMFQALSNDFISNALARVLIAEPIRQLPFLDQIIPPRDIYFEKNLEDSPPYEYAKNKFKSGLRELFSNNSKPYGPALFFGSTDSTTGKRVYFSNVNITDQTDSINAIDYISHDVPISYVIHSSARFPFISPPGKFSNLHLVDGGYRENTGILEIASMFKNLVAYLEGDSDKYTIDRPLMPFCEEGMFGEDEDGVDICNSVVKANEDRVNKALETPKMRAYLKLKEDILDYIDFKFILIRNSKSTNHSTSQVSEIMTSIEAVLSSRESRTKDSVSEFGNLLSLYKEHKSGNIACNTYHREVKEKINLSAHYVDNLITKDSYLDILVSKCANNPKRYDLIEFNLFDENEQDSNIPLGWFLSQKSKNKIHELAKQQVQNQAIKLQPTRIEYIDFDD